MRYRELLTELRSLAKAGMPLRTALEELAARRGGRLAARVLAGLREGRGLGEALGDLPRIVPPAHAALISAGERSGRLDEVLDALLRDLEASRAEREALLSRAAYPTLVLAMALVGAPLSLRAATGEVPSWWPSAMGVSVLIVLLIAMPWAALRWLPAGSAVRRATERILLAIPALRSILIGTSLGRSFWLEGMLLGAGLGFEESLDLAARTARWDRYRAAFGRLSREIREGRTAADAFSRLPGFPDRAAGRLASAETAGRFDEELRELGEELRARALGRLHALLRLFPVLVLLTAAVVVLLMGLSVLGRVTEGL